MTRLGTGRLVPVMSGLVNGDRRHEWGTPGRGWEKGQLGCSPQKGRMGRRMGNTVGNGPVRPGGPELAGVRRGVSR